MTDQPTKDEGGRGVRVVLAIATALAVVGYLTGLSEPTSTEEPLLGAGGESAAPAEAGVDPMPRYDQIAERRRGPNRDWASSICERPETAADGAPFMTATDAERRAAQRGRAERRAYDGAPPVIPHPVAANDRLACRACHQSGLVVGELQAPAMSHRVLTNCMQCHVAAQTNVPGGSAIPANAFRPVDPPTHGRRAWIGAPPTIPHSTLMRTECLSCHGPLGHVALRSSHPERVRCMQCHAPSAELDQHASTLSAPR